LTPIHALLVGWNLDECIIAESLIVEATANDKA
jgi:hypothetical protein